MLIVNEIILFVHRYSLANSDPSFKYGNLVPASTADVTEESSLDKTYIGPTGKPLVQSKITHLLGHAIQQQQQAGVTFIRDTCASFLSLNCHVPTVFGKNFHEYSACLSLSHEMIIKLSGHFRYSNAYNRNLTVYFYLYSRFSSQGHLSTTAAVRVVHWVQVLYRTVLHSTVGAKNTRGHTISTSISR